MDYVCDNERDCYDKSDELCKVERAIDDRYTKSKQTIN